MVKRQFFALCFALSMMGNAGAEVEVYGIDKTYSFANWTIRHVVAKTSGTFSEVKGRIVVGRADLSKSSVDARINMFSLNSNHAVRDQNILNKTEYLDATRFGEMRFVSTAVEASSQMEGVLHGKLTLHGVTRAISIPFKVLGYGADPWGGRRMGVEAHTMLKASDFAFGWVKPDAPVGEDIAITLLIEGVKNSPDFKPW